MRRTQQAIRNAMGPVASILTNQQYPYGDTDRDRPPLYGARRDSFSEHDEALRESSFFDPNNLVSPQSPLAPPIEPAPLHDVGTIQLRVGTALDALQSSDHMTPAELSLIKTVRETASDPEILNKIVNNGSFQEFLNFVPSMLFEQRPQITENGGSSSDRAHPHRPIISEYDSEEEYEVSYNRRSSGSSGSSVSSNASSYSSSSPVMSDYETDEETNYLHGRARRMHIVDTDQNNIVQQRALNRLNELCHQISPEISGWRTEGPPSIVETEPEPVISQPTMEGPGVPGIPTPLPTQAAAEKGQSSQWTNPVYLFVITACVIPITILAVTAVVYPSPRTWSLLKSGVKAVCSKLVR